MDELDARRKDLLQDALVAAAHAFLAFMREHEMPPAAVLIPLGDGDVLAVGSPEAVAGLAKPGR